MSCKELPMLTAEPVPSSSKVSDSGSSSMKRTRVQSSIRNKKTKKTPEDLLTTIPIINLPTYVAENHCLSILETEEDLLSFLEILSPPNED
ncbi:Hypothetical protein CINCED_3A004127 [Cinara cedri]|uniref:Uncharacterized protein n=1 Tax=Cinara cedri TaxID=506608 RepID=A0A5E4MBA4_9HEMI|nr:Hypothetical protein CINCED_3A004127 [Cinara cedri]